MSHLRFEFESLYTKLVCLSSWIESNNNICYNLWTSLFWDYRVRWSRQVDKLLPPRSTVWKASIMSWHSVQIRSAMGSDNTRRILSHIYLFDTFLCRLLLIKCYLFVRICRHDPSIWLATHSFWKHYIRIEDDQQEGLQLCRES